MTGDRSSLHEDKQARVWLGPERPSILLQAIEGAGGSVVGEEDANVIVWSSPNEPPQAITRFLHRGIEWVQLDSAGVDDWIREGVIDRTRTWTSARGLYGALTAEHALALLFAAAKNLPEAVRMKEWRRVVARPLAGSTVGVVGAGGVGREIIRYLDPLDVRTIALSRSGRLVPQTDLTVGPESLDMLLRDSDYVILCLPLTDSTRGMIGERELDNLGPESWLINVARGALVDTDSLVASLERRAIAGACLDVTDPEPLPDSHPLWRFPNVLITPHVANPWGAHYPFLAKRVSENLRRFREGQELAGKVDLEIGY